MRLKLSFAGLVLLLLLFSVSVTQAQASATQALHDGGEAVRVPWSQCASTAATTCVVRHLRRRLSGRAGP